MSDFAGQLKQQRDTILAERGVMITYKQRGIVIKNVPAVPSKSKHLNEMNGDRRYQSIDRKYTIEFALLKWNGKRITPKPGDNIIDGDIVYEVVPTESKQCYSPVDPDETYIRIFVHQTKIVGNGGGASTPPPDSCNHRPMTDQEVIDLIDSVFST